MSVTSFYNRQPTKVPESLRTLANAIEHGNISCCRVVVLIEPPIESDHKLEYRCFGEQFSVSHAVGLCTMGAHAIGYD